MMEIVATQAGAKVGLIAGGAHVLERGHGVVNCKPQKQVAG